MTTHQKLAKAQEELSAKPAELRRILSTLEAARRIVHEADMAALCRIQSGNGEDDPDHVDNHRRGVLIVGDSLLSRIKAREVIALLEGSEEYKEAKAIVGPLLEQIPVLAAAADEERMQQAQAREKAEQDLRSAEQAALASKQVQAARERVAALNS